MENTVQVNAQIRLYTRTKGGNVTVKLPFSAPRGWKFLCKEKCERENVLIETTNDRAQSGRFSIRYEAVSVSRATLSVSITQLTKSDTGLYRCGLGRSSSSAAFVEFEVIVIDGEFLY